MTEIGSKIKAFLPRKGIVNLWKAMLEVLSIIHLQFRQHNFDEARIARGILPCVRCLTGP